MKNRKKHGSATFLVIMVMTVVLILSFSLVPLTLSSINQSSMMYRRNKGFYGAEGSLEKVLYHVDAFSERARKKVNEECFDIKNKIPNMNDIYIAKIYEMHSSAIAEIIAKNEQNKEEDIAEEDKLLEDRVRAYYMYKYNLYMQDFFTSNNTSQIKQSLNLKDNLINSTGENFFTWTDLKGDIESSKDNGNQKIVLIETLNEIRAGSEFERFIPTGSGASIGDFTSANIGKIEKLKSKEQIVNPQEIMTEFENKVMINKDPLKETFYIKTLDDKNTSKYATVTIEMDPLKESQLKTENVTGSLYSSVLDYGIISEKNLAVGNNLTVNSDVIVNGEVYPKDKPSDNDFTKEVRYGGIIAGHDQALLSKYKVPGIVSGAKGNVTINGDAYVGHNINDEKTPSFQGGFVQTATDGSTINIKNNVFCHSVMVGKGVDGIGKDSISIGESAFVADNVTLNGLDANVNIGKNIVGYEDGAETNSKAQYLASPSIAINKYEEDGSTNSSKLKVGGQVTLFGEVFAESWVRTVAADEKSEAPPGTKVLYKTFQTVGIYGNLYAFSEYFWELGLQSKKEYKDEWYSTYELIGDPELQKPDFIDKYKADSKIGSSYILDYLNNKEVTADGVIGGFDLGKGWLEVPNININSPIDKDLLNYMDILGADVKAKKDILEDIKSNDGVSPIGVEDFASRINGNGGSGLNISYFNSFFIQDGKIYLNYLNDHDDPFYDYNMELINNVNAKLGGTESDKRVILPAIEYRDEFTGKKVEGYETVSLLGQLNNRIFDPIKVTLSRRLNLEDVVTYKTLDENGFSDYKSKKGLDRCFNWDVLKGVDIKSDPTDKEYIYISNGDIHITQSDNLDGKDVLIISRGNVIIDSPTNINIKGNILARGNIITKGGAIEITPDKAAATRLINNCSDPRLAEFFKVSSSGKPSSTVIETITKQNKTNISVVSRKELLN
ncbi:MAG: hypothetical protein RR898_09090 [Clostridium sp.]|uniref:hypothetical protein n=1 Tax=Clostridium sp. TaxID=1506 RepID=UPI002FCA33C8